MNFARLNLLLVMISIISINADNGSAGTVIGAACNSGNAATVCTVTNSTCNQTSSMCECQTGFDNKNDQCEAVLGKNCAAEADCTGVANTTCSTTCVCIASFKTSGATCVPKGLGDTCAQPEDCAAVKNSTCDNSSHKCACAATHKEVSGQCKAKGLGDQCQDDTDCVAVKSSFCNTTTTHKCECPKTHKEDGGQCKERVIGKACTASNEATVCTLENSSCNKTMCACKTGFHNQNDQCLTDHQDSSADSHRLAFSIFASSLMLTIRKMF